MDQHSFDAECQRLARPWLDLRRRREGKAVGVWGGPGPMPPPEGDWEHWFTVSCDWLARHGFHLSGLLGVYKNCASRKVREFVALLGEPSEAGWGEGIELAGTEELSLPPPEALELFGNRAVRDLVRGDPTGTPLAHYDEGCPLYRKGIFISLGGWHISWPEHDAYDEETGRLVLWTFQDAEPWLEVWQRPSGILEVMPRIT